MNKEEKIGMYTRNEIFEHLCENSDIGMLGRSMYDAVMSKIDNLQSQLQSYKDKEDKIREYITSYESISTIQGLDNIEKNKDLDNTTMIEMTNRYLEVHDKLLQILNDKVVE